MRVTACLSWFDERPQWLAEAILSLEGVADHLVALDGAYALLPDAKRISPGEQHIAIKDACARIAIGCDIHVPPEPFAENETEKRTLLFEHANRTSADWFYIVDADELVTCVPWDLKDRLAQTKHDVVEVSMVEHGRSQAFRKFFRAQPIKVIGNHYTYISGDGKRLWAASHNKVPAESIRGFQLFHRSWERDPQRRERQKAYYDLRHERGTEYGRCELCSEKGIKAILGPWARYDEETEVRYSADWVNVCQAHIEEMKQIRTESAHKLGLDPETGHPLPALLV